MSDPIFWSNVQVQVGATHAAGLVVSAITKALPGVVSYTGTDPANGDFFIFPDIVGMVQLKNRVFRIANVSTGGNTFELEGEDTTAYSTFVSGNAVGVATFDQMTTVQDVTGSGGDANFADTSTIHNDQQTQAPVTFSPLVYSFTCLFDAADAAMVRLRVLSNTKVREAIVFTFADGTQFAFYAYSASSGAPVGQKATAVTTTVSLNCQGRPNVYGG